MTDGPDGGSSIRCALPVNPKASRVGRPGEVLVTTALGQVATVRAYGEF